jgi:protein disulfide-isomerase
MATRAPTSRVSAACRWLAAAALATMATLAATPAAAAALPYDAAADARADIRGALAQAQRNHRNVLLVFGANWCEDCRALDKALRSPRNATLMASEFEVVKVDVGKFDRNLDIAAEYGNAVAKGIPSAVVLSPGGAIVYATRAGELADARRMSETGVHDFFERVVKAAPSRQ